MNMTMISRLCILFLALMMGSVQNSFAGVQISENFDTNWPGAPWSYTVYTNVVNPVSGWSISSNSIASQSSYYSTPSNSCFFAKGGLSALTSPFLTNGIGALIYDAKHSSGSSYAILALESSFNGSTWFTNSIISNNVTTMTGYTNIINSISNQYFRFRRIDSAGSIFALDTVRITYPTPVVTISNVFTTPASPADQDSVTNSATVGIQSVPDSFAMTNYWHVWPASNWTAIAMTSNSPTLYTASSAIPGYPIGTRVEYYAQANFTGNYITSNATSFITNYTVIPKSSYTNLSVTGQLNAPLGNGANYQWQNVVYVTSTNPTFQFQGISNGVTNTWGDINQTVTNIPLYGQAEATTSNITLYTTSPGYYLFAISETDLTYSVRSCAYENFNSWTGGTYDAFSIYTNPATGWTLSNGNTSNDTSRILGGTGRSAVVETNGWIQTPYLSNGVGQISFWYRNWPTDGAPSGTFQIQTSSNAINWNVPVGTVSNIVSTNYLFFSAVTNDYNSKYVRILNAATSATARLCFDEVAIAQAGAGVTGTNLGTTPASPTILDPISIAITLNPYNGASISNVTAWYRAGTNGVWETGAMTATDGVHYTLSAPIIGAPTGTLQYAVQCSFSGFQAGSPVFFPPGFTNSPSSVTVSAPNRQENFDTNWPGAPWSYTVYTNVVNPVSGWSISSNSIASQSSYYSTPSNSCFFAKGGLSALTSPFLTNGIGALIYDAKHSSGSSYAILALESSFNGSTWFTNSIISNNVTTMTGYTNIINSISNQYFRFRRIDSAGSIFALDTVRITYPPANVALTNVFITPGYPVAGQAFTASCDVVTLNPYFPAYNIAPVFQYWTGTATNSQAMTRTSVSGPTNHYTAVISLASVTRDTPYSYNVRASFDGYYGSATENQSPKTSPPGSFTARAYSSQYGAVNATLNGTNTPARMLTNGLWQSIVSFGITTGTTFNLSFQGAGYSAGAGYLTNNVQWGNSNNWKTTLPLDDFAGTNQNAITNLTGTFTGDYVVRFNEQTGEYLVERCVFQDFESWVGAGAGSTYVRSENVNFPLVTNNFDSWVTNVTMTRVDDFSSADWQALSAYTNYAFGGVQGFVMYFSRIQGMAVQTTTNNVGDSFIAQLARFPTPSSGNLPLRGIGTVSYTYSVPATNPAVILNIKGYNGATNWDAYASPLSWFDVPGNSLTNPPNSGTKTVVINTNATFDVIFSHANGAQIVTLDNVSVSEWYADSQTNGGWITSEGFIEQRGGGAAAGNLCCKFDITRNSLASDQQYVVSPYLSNGVNSISFSYCGGNTNPESFNLDIRYGAGAWSTLASITNSTTNYTAYSCSVGTTANNAQLRVRNTTPAPGILLVDDFKISAKIAGMTWGINNASIDETDPATPPSARQFYGAACYLNSNRTANINFADTTNAPDTNATAYLVSPKLSMGGIGEISFWYRNWAIPPNPVIPASLYVQTSTKDLPSATNAADWATVAVLSNVVNTNDYQYCQVGLYDTTSQWIRIYNDISTNVGRACLDDVLITAPIASSFAMSNLTVSPLIPLYTNTVDVLVDVYQLFLNPTNITLTALYGTATNYAGVTNAALTALPMTCIASNVNTPGRWYRYKTSTPIPTNAIDTFVRYSAKASWGGYNAQVASPTTNFQFATTPTWYNPLYKVYTNNLAYYIVYSCPTGAVWINEFNTDDGNPPTAQYVELCGPAGTRIGNWQLQVWSDVAVVTALYNVTNSTTLPSTTNGFGFWVIGDTNVSASLRNQTLTNLLPNSGGLRLVRSCGTYEYSICFSPNDISTLVNTGFVNIGTYDDSTLDIFYGNQSVGLWGTGSNYQAFAWTSSTYLLSPGAMNGGQLLVGTTQNSVPPVITIWSCRVNTNVWIECTRTSGWYNTPWYSTNLLNSNLWTTVASFTNVPNASNDVLSFTKPTNNTAYFFKVVATNGL